MVSVPLRFKSIRSDARVGSAAAGGRWDVGAGEARDEDGDVGLIGVAVAVEIGVGAVGISHGHALAGEAERCGNPTTTGTPLSRRFRAWA